MSLEGIGSRIKEAAERVGGLDRLADLVPSMSRRSLSDYVNEKTDPRASLVREIAAATGVPVGWLIAGDDYKAEGPGMVTLPRYDEVRASAGYGLAVLDETAITRISVELRWLIELGAAPASTIILPAGGDSMEPTIRNGAPMFVDTSKTEVRNGHIYVFNVNGDLVVKRIERLFDGSFDLISDNNRYPTRNLSQATIETLTVIGLVLAAVNTF